jgi:hypothetical protein
MINYLTNLSYIILKNLPKLQTILFKVVFFPFYENAITDSELLESENNISNLKIDKKSVRIPNDF